MIDELLKRLGFIILADDYKDIGEMGRIHHWQWGFLIMQVGRLIEKVKSGEAGWGDLFEFFLRNGAIFLQIVDETKKRG